MKICKNLIQNGENTITILKSMKKKKTSKIETGVIDFMVAVDPETVF